MANEGLPNLVKVADGLYIVRTQAGFRKAFKSHADDPSEWASRDKNAYPKSYPALIQVRHIYNRGSYQLTMIDLTDVVAVIAPYLTELTGPRHPAFKPKPPRTQVKK